MDIPQILYTVIDLKFFIGFITAFILIYVIVSKKIRRELRWPIFGTLSSAVLAYILAVLAKLVFRIPRPCFGHIGCPGDFSFPSEHATIIFSMAVFLMLYKKDWKFSVAFLSLAVLISISRVIVGVHTYQDVIAGALLGSLIGYVVYTNGDRVFDLIKGI